MKHYHILLLLTVLPLNVHHCTSVATVAGTKSGSETTNGITASVYKCDGTPAGGALVRMRKNDYVTQPPLAMTKPAIYGADASTDEQGRFEIKGIDPGAYSIEVNDPSAGSARGGAVLFTCSITAHDTLDLGTDTLRPFAGAYGTVDMSSMSGRRLFVQVLGLVRLVQVDSAGTFDVNDLPAGHFSLHIVATQGAQATLIRSDSVSVVPGATVNVSMPGWKFFKRLFLNTTASGADVAGNVYDFPALIRLTNSNFNFIEAQAVGGDIRFAKPDGTPVPYEIERWDSGAQAADVWVKVDTVFGNDLSHFVMMYWGNPAATAGLSNAGEVFDTANGNVSVWHMNQIGNGPVKDATWNHYDGVSYNMAAASAVPGIVGVAQNFDGATSYLIFPGTANSALNLPEKGSYTVSAWAYTTKLDANYYMIASKGDKQYNLEIMYTNDWEFAECRAAGGYTDVFSPASISSWNYVAGVRNGDKEYLYVDGVCTDSTISVLDTMNFRNTGDDFTIGKMANGSSYYFSGMIDEVRVLNRPESPDWIKLCFMNQRPQDALMVFK